MDKHQKIFAVLFMICLLGFSAYNIYAEYGNILYEISEIEEPKTADDLKQYTLSIDSALTTNLAFGYMWNEAYAKVYNILGKNEENSFKYVRDKQGMMYQANFWNTSPIPIKEYALRIKRLEAAVANKGTKVVVLLYPTQYNEAWSDGYYGIPYNDYNDVADQMVSFFRYYGIDHIDYKPLFMDKYDKAVDIFYKTDHHWKLEVAFEAFGTMVDHLNEKYDAKLDKYYTDINNYNVETYEDIFIGSQGRDAGYSYVGLDDYTFILPKFDTSYVYSYKNLNDNEETLTGGMEEILITKNYLERDNCYDRDMWNSYMGGIHLSDHLVNKNNEDGLNVLFLRDSYTSPIATFFSSYCNTVDMVWTVQTDPERIEAAVETGDYDYIFVAMAADSFIGYGAEFYIEEEDKDE